MDSNEPNEGNEMTVGTNNAFKVVWNCTAQKYTVYKNGKYLITKYSYSAVKSYLN